MSELHEAGKSLSFEDIEMIVEAIERRRKNFPDEPKEMSIGLILANIGDRFTPVACVNGEWRGVKKDIPKGEGVPTCPNGHVMTQEPGGLTLGWVSVIDPEEQARQN